jgi:hypothetical protein
MTQLWLGMRSACSPPPLPSTGGACRAQAADLVAALGQRSVSEVLDYDRIHGQLMAESYRWELWGAAYLIGGGGCSDDGFDDFRGWLLGQGRATWQAALADPDSLADHPRSAAVGPTRRWSTRFGARTCCTPPTTPTRR